jgi:hypothetical protein
MAVERRRHPRISANWPAVVQTRKGRIEAEIRDISESGAFIEFTEELDLGDDFQITLKPSEDRSILVTGEKAWCGNISINGKDTYTGMGVRFVNISPADRKYISGLVDREPQE